MIWIQNPAQLDCTMLNYYFTGVISFLFPITHTQSSPLDFCVSCSSILISSLVFFDSFSLVWVRSAVVWPSCFSSQPIASCGSSRDTMYLYVSSACFLIPVTSFCRESMMPSWSVTVPGPTPYSLSWKVIYIHLEIANNYTTPIISTESLEDHYVLKHLSAVNSNFKAILWAHWQSDCQFLPTFTQKSPTSTNSYFSFKAFNGPSSHGLFYHHKSTPSKFNIKAGFFTQWEHWMNTASKQL